MKMTPWFKWPAKPVRPGWYDFRGLTYDAPVRMLFNGRRFGWQASNGDWIDLADDASDEWRGLASPSTASA